MLIVYDSSCLDFIHNDPIVLFSAICLIVHKTICNDFQFLSTLHSNLVNRTGYLVTLEGQNHSCVELFHHYERCHRNSFLRYNTLHCIIHWMVSY